MSIEAATIIPERMTLVDMRTGEELEVLFNPTELDRVISAEYSRRAVVGLSHEPLQFTHTKNEALSFSLYCAGLGPEAQEQIADFDRFLSSLVVPSSTAQDIAGGGPPDVLMIWPAFVSMRCRVISVRFKYTTFAAEGRPTRYTADCALEEHRTRRLTSEEVRRNGLRRASRAARDT